MIFILQAGHRALFFTRGLFYLCLCPSICVFFPKRSALRPQDELCGRLKRRLVVFAGQKMRPKKATRANKMPSCDVFQAKARPQPNKSTDGPHLSPQQNILRRPFCRSGYVFLVNKRAAAPSSAPQMSSSPTFRPNNSRPPHFKRRPASRARAFFGKNTSNMANQQ